MSQRAKGTNKPGYGLSFYHMACVWLRTFLSLGTGTRVWPWWLSLVGLKLGEDGGVEAVILEP